MSSEDHGPKINPEDRKLRNRLSQKAFRTRQIMRIKELEQRLEARPATETQITALEDRNAFLCNQLLENHKKMISIHFSLKTLIDSSAKILEEVTNCSNMSTEDDTSSPSNSVGGPLAGVSTEAQFEDGTAETEAENAANWNSSFLVAEGTTLDLSGLFGGFVDQCISDELSPREHLFRDKADLEVRDLQNMQEVQHLLEGQQDFEATIASLPLSFTLSQTGPEAYASLSKAGPLLLNEPRFQFQKTNSNFSDHILSIENLLRQNLSGRERGLIVDAGSHLYRLTSSVHFMLSVMVCVSWQTMGAWHSYTKSHIPVGHLTAWRVDPSPATLAKVPLCYQPTKLQLSMPHPAVIDWVPWASMRDKVILYHSASPRLDELMSDFGNYYVMEVDLPKLVAGFPPTPGYVSVWDLVRVIAPEATSDAAVLSQRAITTATWETCFQERFTDSNTGTFHNPPPEGMGPPPMDESEASLPAPNTTALFNSKTLALKAFEMMGMGNGPNNFRLDPAFFSKYPELYDGTSDLMARGIPLRPTHHTTVPVPVPCPLASEILSQYKELASWTACSVS